MKFVQLTVTKIVQIKNCSYVVHISASATLNEFREVQSTTTGGNAFHSIIVRGMKENLKVSLWGRMGAYFQE